MSRFLRATVAFAPYKSTHGPDIESTPLIDDELPSVPRRGFALESALLRQAGSQFRPCVNNEQCRGVLDWQLIPGLCEPVVLASSMEQHEFEHAEADWVHDAGDLAEARDGAHEYEPQPCVLCHRYSQVLTIMLERRRTQLAHHESSIEAPHPTKPLDLQRARPIQTYYNPKDTADGYDGEWMMHPMPGDPFFLPVVDCPLNVLRGYRDAAGFWRIDQSALQWVDAPPLAPAAGERVSDFMKRASATDGLDHAARTRGKRQRLVRASCYVESLLRPWPDPGSCLTWSFASSVRGVVVRRDDAWWLNVRQLEAVVDRSIDGLACSDEYYFRACQLFDSLPASLPESRDWVRVSELEPDQLVTDTTLDPVWHRLIFNMSYFTPLSGVSDDLLHQLSKSALKQRCQTRNAQDMIVKHMVTRKLVSENVYRYNASLFRMCKDMLLCSLLGNYPDRERDFTLSTGDRRELAAFFRDDRSRRWVMNFFMQCPFVLNACIRDFAVYSWTYRPALRAAIGDLVRTDDYLRMNGRFIDRVRREMFANGAWKADLATLPKEPCALRQFWSCGLKDCGIPCPHLLLTTSQLKSMRGRHFDRMRGADTETMMSELLDLSMPAEDEDAAWTRPHEYEQFKRDRAAEAGSGWTWTASELHARLQALGSEHEAAFHCLAYRRPRIQSRELFRPRRDHGSGRDIDGGLRERAEAVIERSNPLHGKCLDLALGELEALGVRPSAAAEIRALFHGFATRAVNAHVSKKRWQDWRRRDASAHSVVSFLDAAIQDARQRATLTPLSREMAEQQLGASRRLYGELWSPRNVCLVYCDRCKVICSPCTDDRGHHLGLLHIKTSCLDRSVCCGSCSGALVWMNLLGKLLTIHHASYTLCPSCGFIVLVTHETTTGEHGFACALCTVRPRPPIERTWKQRAREGRCAVRTCHREPTRAVGTRSLTEMSARWLWGADAVFANMPRHDVFVCNKHFKPGMVPIAASMAQDAFDEVEDAIDREWKRKIRR